MNLKDLAMNYDSKDVKRSYASVLTGTDTNLNQHTMIKDNDFSSGAEVTLDPHQPTKEQKVNMSNHYQVLSEDKDDEDDNDSTYFDPTNKPIPRSTAVMMALGSTHTKKIDILPSFNPNKMIPDPTDFDPPITKLTRSHADRTSMMTQASCDEDGDEDHGMTTSAPSCSSSASQRRRHRRRRRRSSNRKPVPTDYRSSHPTTDATTMSKSTDRSYLTTTTPMKRKSMSVSSVDVIAPAITPLPATKIHKLAANPRQSERLSNRTVSTITPYLASTVPNIMTAPIPNIRTVDTRGEHKSKYFGIFEPKNKKQKKHPPTASPVTSNVIAGPKTTVEDKEGGSTLKSSLVPKQLGPDKLCATVITINNGPNAEVYTIEFGVELIKLLVLKDQEKNRHKDSKLWSFVDFMSNKNDGSYLCVHLQSGPAIAFLTNPLRENHRQQFPKLSNTIKVYNDELAPLCISSKMNIMATGKAATSFHSDHSTDKEGVRKEDRLIHCINIGKKLSFRMTDGKCEHSIVCSTNTQHHIVSGNHCTYCDSKIAKHKGSNMERGIVLTLVADPKPNGKMR